MTESPWSFYYIASSSDIETGYNVSCAIEPILLESCLLFFLVIYCMNLPISVSVAPVPARLCLFLHSDIHSNQAG